MMGRILRTDFLSAAIRTTPPHFFRSDCRGSHLRLAELFRRCGKTKILLDTPKRTLRAVETRLIQVMLVSSVMVRKSLAALLFLIAFPIVAQQSDAPKVVAVVNGETITAQKLDQLYARMGAQLRQQYEKAGGKTAFLDN